MVTAENLLVFGMGKAKTEHDDNVMFVNIKNRTCKTVSTSIMDIFEKNKYRYPVFGNVDFNNNSNNNVCNCREICSSRTEYAAHICVFLLFLVILRNDVSIHATECVATISLTNRTI